MGAGAPVTPALISQISHCWYKQVYCQEVFICSCGGGVCVHVCVHTCIRIIYYNDIPISVSDSLRISKIHKGALYLVTVLYIRDEEIPCWIFVRHFEEGS